MGEYDFELERIGKELGNIAIALENVAEAINNTKGG